MEQNKEELKMTFKLSEKPLVKYSKREALVFNILKNRKQPARVEDIAERFFDLWKGNQPFFSKIQVGGVARALSRKVDFNKEPFMIERSRQPGAREVSWQVKSRGKS